MKSGLKRKQFILPQKLLCEVRKAYKTKTETEAVILSLEEALNRKKIEGLINLPGKIKFDMTQKDLRKLRGK